MEMFTPKRTQGKNKLCLAREGLNDSISTLSWPTLQEPLSFILSKQLMD